MSVEALREVFAMFDMKADTSVIERANAIVENLTKNVKALLQASAEKLGFGSVDTAKTKVEALTKDTEQLEKPIDPKVNVSSFDRLKEKIKELFTSLRSLGVAIATTFMVRRVWAFIDRIRALGDELDKTSQQLGLSTRALQEWRHVAGLGGMESNQLTVAMAQMAQKAQLASTGGQEAARVFRQLGVSVKDSSGQLRGTDEMLLDIADGFQRIQNPTQRTALAMQLFGEQGRRLLPAMTSGRAGILELRHEVEALGGGASQEMIQASVELTDSITRFRLALLSLRSRIAVLILPIINRMTVALTDLSAWFSRIAGKSRILQVVMYTLGAIAVVAAVKMAVAWGATLWPLLLAAAAIGVVILVVDDLAVAMDGGQSVIGDFIDSLFGIGTTASVVRDLKDAWEGLGQAISDAWGWISEFAGIQSELWGLIFSGDEDKGHWRSAHDRVSRFTGEDQESMDDFLRRSNKFRRARERGEVVVDNPEPDASSAVTATNESDEDFLRRTNAERRARRAARAQGQSPTTTTARSTVTAPTTVRVPTGRNQVVDARATTTVNINAPAANPAEVARLAVRELERTLEQQRRQTSAALSAED